MKCNKEVTLDGLNINLSCKKHFLNTNVSYLLWTLSVYTMSISKSPFLHSSTSVHVQGKHVVYCSWGPLRKNICKYWLNKEDNSKQICSSLKIAFKKRTCGYLIKVGCGSILSTLGKLKICRKYSKFHLCSKTSFII